MLGSEGGRDSGAGLHSWQSLAQIQPTAAFGFCARLYMSDVLANCSAIDHRCIGHAKASTPPRLSCSSPREPRSRLKDGLVNGMHGDGVIGLASHCMCSAVQHELDSNLVVCYVCHPLFGVNMEYLSQSSPYPL